jgi:hypothetical protein
MTASHADSLNHPARVPVPGEQIGMFRRNGRLATLVAHLRAKAAARRATRVPAMVAMALVMGGAAALPSEAQQVGWHPATSAAARPVVGIDPNTYILGHAASPTTRGGHANFEHPAVRVARAAAKGGIDPNTFLVQPPATVTWIATPEQDDGRRYAQAERARLPAAP